jgi:LacI family transcriptional regulator, repressor for deo operon, udp, cdd, tsx, nupC, and nupG
MKASAKRPQRTVNLKQIAQELGLAVSTVSRALSNPGRVSKGTLSKVTEAADRLHYTTHAVARSLRVGQSRLLMALVPERQSSESVVQTLAGIDEALMARGYGLVLAHLDRIQSTERQLFELACSGLVDGAITIGPHPDGAASLHALPLPSVSLLVDRSALGVPSVVTDDRAAMKRAAQHLLALGHERFLYVGGRAGEYHEEERHAGVREALAQAGLPAKALRRHAGHFDIADGEAAARAYLLRPDRPSAVVCWNDYMAIGFMKTVREAGLKVPQDVAVTGFDGIEGASYCEPGLTTLAQPFRTMGAAGATMLLAIVEGRAPAPPLRTVVESTLVVRKSSLAA